MTWEIAIGIFALVSFVGVFVGAAWKLSSTVSKLSTIIATLQKSLEDIRNDSRASHRNIYEKLDNHENRITTIEAVVK